AASELNIAPEQERFMPLWVASLTLALCAGYAAVYAGPFGWSRHAGFIGILLIAISAAWGIAMVLMFIESPEVTHFRDDPMPQLSAGLVIAAVVFLLHASIDLALFWSGAATLLFAVLAIGQAAGGSESEALVPNAIE